MSPAVAGTGESRLSKQRIWTVENGEYELSETTGAMFDYRARVLDAELSERLTSIGAVIIDWAEGLREDGNRPPASEEFSPLPYTDPNTRACWNSTRASCWTTRRQSFSMHGSSRRRYGTRCRGMSMICAVVASTS